MNGIDVRTTTDGLTELIRAEDSVGLTAFVRALPPTDLNLIFSRLVSSETAASILHYPESATV